MTNKKYHTVGTGPKYHTVGTDPKYHTVGTGPKYYTVGTGPNTTLSEQVQNLLIKWQMKNTTLSEQVQNLLIKWQIKNTTLSEQVQNLLIKWQTRYDYEVSSLPNRINSGHHCLPTYQILMISDNVKYLPPILYAVFWQPFWNGRHLENFENAELLL